MPRRIDARRIKIHRNYTVADVAETLDVHRNTVRNWEREGLPVLDDRKPRLYLGRALKSFLEERCRKRKRPLAPGEIYCVACHAPKVPAEGMADYVPSTVSSGTLSGLCPDCGNMIYRRLSQTSLDKVSVGLDVQIQSDQ